MTDQCMSPECKGALVLEQESSGGREFHWHCASCLLGYQTVRGQWSIAGPLRVELLRNSLDKEEVIDNVLRVDFDDTWAHLRISEARAGGESGLTRPFRWDDVKSIQRMP